MLSDIVQHATPTPLCEYPVKPLKGILEKDYASYAASLYEEAGIVDHRIVTRLMRRARPSPQVWLALKSGMSTTSSTKVDPQDINCTDTGGMGLLTTRLGAETGTE